MNKEQLVNLLIENKAYPCYSKKGKIFFITPKKSEFLENMKDKIIDGLNLKSEEDCKNIREIIKIELAKRRTNKPIRKWVKEERPREMVIKLGAEKLNSAKLLAIILRSGIDGISAEDLARELLNKFGSLRTLDSASISDLCSINGIGMAKATQIKAALEIGKRLLKEEAEKKKKINTVEDVVKYTLNYYRPWLRDSKKEFFNIILLDGRNKPIKNVELTKGTLTSSIVDPKEIIKEATKESAAAIILVHNHPSGEAEPTQDDIETTQRLIQACNLVGIKILDHIIIGKNRSDYTSFSDKGLIKED